uniref:DDE_3 domain-containing protein n=1 Tax=Heterorhabditis bacteriophora TaxID=37862 RepID=A0A1I7XD20_HETBA
MLCLEKDARKIFDTNGVVQRMHFSKSVEDSALSHKTKKTATMEYLRRQALGFITLSQWPSNSPDLNPVDCKL